MCIYISAPLLLFSCQSFDVLRPLAMLTLIVHAVDGVKHTHSEYSNV